MSQRRERVLGGFSFEFELDTSASDLPIPIDTMTEKEGAAWPEELHLVKKMMISQQIQ